MNNMEMYEVPQQNMQGMIPQGQGMPQGMPPQGQGMPPQGQGMPQGMPQDMPPQGQGMPQGMPRPYSIVQGFTNLIRDDRTKAILNTNMSEYENYMYLKSIKEEENTRIENLEKDLTNLKDGLDEIKNMLRSLVK